MEPRLIKGIHAEYVPAQWAGRDTSGVRVVGKTVLVLMDQCAPKTAGDIVLPEDVIERMSMAADSGAAMGPARPAARRNEVPTRRRMVRGS